MQRRNFLGTVSALAGGAVLHNKVGAANVSAGKGPVVISTWAPNAKANAAAFAVLKRGGSVLDAVEQGIWVPEADPQDQSVGYGGLPDRDGKVTLDACIMDDRGNCGSVMFLEEIMHPISVARAVMEKTPHVQLVGEGALGFALSQGFKRENLLTPEAEQVWREWLKTAKYDPMDVLRLLEGRSNEPMPNHDTIGMLAIDGGGRLAGGCSTSGMAFKMRGRVGDSPIIGSGLFVDPEAGAATGTGVGEEVMRIAGAHSIVESMRSGSTPEVACMHTLQRYVRLRGKKAEGIQIGFIALNRRGDVGGYALQPGFNFAVHTNAGTKVYNAKSIFKASK